MFSTLTPARPAVLHIGDLHPRALAVAAAIAVAASGTAIMFSDDEPVAPAKPNAAQTAPVTFGDPTVLKGARADTGTVVTAPVFGDPTIRKGAHGR